MSYVLARKFSFVMRGGRHDATTAAQLVWFGEILLTTLKKLR